MGRCSGAVNEAISIVKMKDLVCKEYKSNHINTIWTIGKRKVMQRHYTLRMLIVDPGTINIFGDVLTF